MALRFSALFLVIATCLSLAVPSFSQDVYPKIVDKDYSCGPGFVPIIGQGGNFNPQCIVDPCFGNPGPCGEGNKCSVKATTVSGLTALESVCTCAAPAVVSHIVYKDFCYVPGTDRCNPNPCKNGGTCQAVSDFNGAKGAFECSCPSNFQGTTCELPNPSPTAKSISGSGTPPPPPPTQPPIISQGPQGLCGLPGKAAAFPQRCWFNSDPRGRYVCCDNQGCDGFNADNLIPHCKNYGYVPPKYGETDVLIIDPTNIIIDPIPPQGLCGLPGDAGIFPNRCWFNNDPLGRYVCCDNQGCDGFNADNLTPHCKNYGYVPPNFGVTGPVKPTGGNNNGGTEGVCGSGAASAFPKRCWYNNDPQGRYVCCDNDGCNGFAPPDNLYPRCKSNGYVPQNL